MNKIDRRVVVSAVIQKDGKYLMTQQGNGTHKGYWAFPGGGVEMDDEDLLQAIRREVREEVKLEIENEKILDAYVFIDKEHDIQLVAIFFLANIKKGEPSLTNEVQDYKWVSLDEMKNINREKLRPPVVWFEKLIQKL